MDLSPEALARTLALQNAVRHKGTANAKALIGGMLGAHPEFKERMPELAELLERTVKDVNRLTPTEQEAVLRKERPEFDKTEKKEGLKPLPDAKMRAVVLRFEPSPSGALHIGHAYPFSLNLEYAKMYDGKCMLRIADTNPDNITEEAYTLLPQDACWLAECDIEVLIQSSRMELYYSYARKLIEEGHAYVCECDTEEFKRLKEKGLACPCRGLSKSEHAKRWRRMGMAQGYAQGAAVVRFKSDITHKNPAMRDFPLMRINDSKHPKTGMKYRVWPLMNFSVAIDDLDLGVTHTIRAKDHADNAKKQALIHESLGSKTPVAISVGRINFDGFPMSASKTRARIEAGEFTGWDDPRLPFLPALRRRGYRPEALRKYAVEVGVTRNDKTVAIEEFFKHIDTLDKELVDAEAMRYFFVADPVEIIVTGAPEQSLELDLHPDKKEGGRKFLTHERFLIARRDLERIAGLRKIRLMECMTINVQRKKLEKDGEKTGFSFHRKKYDKAETQAIIHWLPADEDRAELVTVRVLMPDGSVEDGLAERTVANVKEGAVVQFERFGFCRYDHHDGERHVFYYGHR